MWGLSFALLLYMPKTWRLYHCSLTKRIFCYHEHIEMEELITKHSTIMDKYDPAEAYAWWLMNGVSGLMKTGTNQAFLYQQNGCDAHVAGTNLNIFNNHL